MYVLASKVESGYSESPRNLFFRFEVVHFFDGPLWWPGANFSLAPVDECEELWRKVNHRNYDERTLHELAQTTPLFIVNVPSYRIRLLAEKGQVDNFPHMLSSEQSSA